MAINKSIGYNYSCCKKIDYEDIHCTVFCPYANVERKYVVEYRVPPVDVLGELPVEYVSILIQFPEPYSKKYDILNVYYKGHNHKAENFVRPYRMLLDKIVHLIEK